MSTQKCYKMSDGRILFASGGLGGKTFMTMYKFDMADNSRHRFKSKNLPERMNLNAAQEDLNLFAQVKRLECVELDVE